MPPKSPPTEVHGRTRLRVTEQGEILTINGTDYLLTRHDADPSVANPAWRLVKIQDGKVIDVHCDDWGLPLCTCEDYSYRRENQQRGCKHVESLRVHGLLARDT